jgi:hypothetical protein
MKSAWFTLATETKNAVRILASSEAGVHAVELYIDANQLANQSPL